MEKAPSKRHLFVEHALVSVAALPATLAGRKWRVWLVAVLVALVAMFFFWLFSGAGQVAGVTPSLLYTVAPMDMEVKVVKDGELQAVNNIDILCQVEGQTTIQTLVKEGSWVKKGDVLITLDSSEIRQRIEDTTLELQKAEADLISAREMKEIQESTNAANLEAAEVALALAQLDLKQYVEGSYPQQLANAQTELEMARINLKNQEEKLSQTRSLFAKGFVTATAVKEDELAVTTARNAVVQAETALKVLTEYTHQMELASKQSAVSQAEQKLARTKRENASALAQKVADVQAKEQALAVLKRRMERYQEQLEACTIRAPADGLVVYATSGDRNAQVQIQEGATVRERQALLKLPDTNSMKAVVRIQEAQVSKLREGQRARVRIVGRPEPLGATVTKISVLADSGQRWWNPDLKEYPVDLTLDHTPAGLKPGMGAQAEIFVDHASAVLAVPLAAIYSTGPDSYVFVRQGDQFIPRKVRIGRTNETHAEILGDAVKSGEQVLLLQVGQGQQLLEKAGIKVSPTTQPRSGEFRQRGSPGPQAQQQSAGGESNDQQRPRRRRSEGGESPAMPGAAPNP